MITDMLLVGVSVCGAFFTYFLVCMHDDVKNLKGRVYALEMRNRIKDRQTR